MSKYIDAEKLIKSVNNYQEGAKAALNPTDGDADYYKGKIDACEDIQEFITSLQQEQPQVADASKMEPEVDLEKEIDKGIVDYSFTKTIDSGGFKTTVIDYAKIARHFYELGLNARKEK